jgi:cyclophilin family peptidyl-prolyl cis-trans isomerase
MAAKIFLHHKGTKHAKTNLCELCAFVVEFGCGQSRVANYWRLALLSLWLFFISGCAGHDQALEEILRLEDRRAPAAAFAQFIKNQNAPVQRRAVIALGRVQDPEAVPLLSPLLDASDAETRAEAAFALGQLAQPQSTGALLRRYAEEKNLEVRLALIEAVSKAANDSALATVSEQLLGWLKDQIPIVRAEASLAAGRLAQRGFKKMEWREPLAQLLNDAGEEARWRAAYALMRLHSGKPTMPPDSAAAPQLIAALGDRSPRVRMQAARALGVMKAEIALAPLTEIGMNDKDWRVRVNAAAALGNFDFPDLLSRLALHDTSEHVRLTALRTLGTATARMRQNSALKEAQPINEFLRERLHQDESIWRERAEAAAALAKIFQRGAIEDLAKLLDHPHAIFRSRLAEALGAAEAAAAFPYLEKLSRDSTARVQIAALEALPQLRPPVQNQAAPIYLKALQSGDAVITATAAQNLAADSLQRRHHAAAIMAAYQKLAPPVDAEAAQMIFAALAQCGDLNARPLLEAAVQFPDKPLARAAAEALKKLAGEDYSKRVPKEIKPAQDFTYEEIRALANARATIQTNKGAIEMEFFPTAAPLTVLNFVRLARKGFFDGIFVHRVVPNFVIQTGDPRGDGWGSPGYSIRSEFSRRRYMRGMVGMASAGTDTEGCQFFITHSEQPHLDGRYTIFARVKSGMEIVDALQVGDRMEKVTIRF